MKSFIVNLNELHCSIHFLMINSKTHNLQVKKALSDLRRQKYPITQDVSEAIEETFSDCRNNPGFTFQLCDTNVVIALREEFLNDSKEYLIGIATHEISHAVGFIFNSLGIDVNDDELRAIEMGNITEAFLKKSKILKR